MGLNDIDVTWVNLDDLFRALSSQQEVSGSALTEFFSFLERCIQDNFTCMVNVLKFRTLVAC